MDAAGGRTTGRGRGAATASGEETGGGGAAGGPAAGGAAASAKSEAGVTTLRLPQYAPQVGRTAQLVCVCTAPDCVWSSPSELDSAQRRRGRRPFLCYRNSDLRRLRRCGNGLSGLFRLGRSRRLFASAEHDYVLTFFFSPESQDREDFRARTTGCRPATVVASCRNPSAVFSPLGYSPIICPLLKAPRNKAAS